MRYLILIPLILIIKISLSQENETTDFLSEINQYDVSDLWTSETFKPEFEGDTSTIIRNEPLGYIGNNFQRFYIHFISAIQNPENKLEYFVFGKTKVKNNICNFQGLISITKSGIFNNRTFSPLKQGYIEGKYFFYEDPDQKGTGILKGTFWSEFYIDKEGKLLYNSLLFGADGYENNQFEGTWTSYNTSIQKKCNWGDYRIPDSKDFSGGCAEFGVKKEYLQFGWLDYMIAWGGELGKISREEARKKEHEKWWK